MESEPAQWQWTIDTEVPAVIDLAGPPEVTNDDATFTFSCSKDDCTFECQIDDSQMHSCAPGVTYENLEDGTHDFVVVATDDAGNASPPASWTWTVDTHDGPRNAGTAIYYLLPHDKESALHRVGSDELWFFQLGDPLELRIQENLDDEARKLTVGCRPQDRLQVLVPAAHWQSACSLGGPAGYTLVACIVVPGFDFADFEMASEAVEEDRKGGRGHFVAK